jgi:integral membrane protein
MNVRQALLLYRIMAYIVGVMLIIVFVSIPFKAVERVVGPFHGALYIVYLAVSLNLVRRARLSWWTMLAMVTGGWIPFAAFIVEHWVTIRLRSGVDEQAAS